MADINDMRIQKANVMSRLGEWDMAAIADRRYYIIKPMEGKYVRTEHLGESTGTTTVDLDPAIVNMFKQDPASIKFCGEDGNGIIYMFDTKNKQYIRSPNIHNEVETTQNPCHNEWPIDQAEHVCASKGKWYCIRGTKYYGTDHPGEVANKKDWENTMHADFRKDALKYFAVNDRWYAVYWDDDFGKLCYRATTNMNTNSNAYSKPFHDDIMAQIPGFVDLVPCIDPLDNKTFLIKNGYPGAAGQWGPYVSFGSSEKHPVRAVYDDQGAMKVTFHKVNYYKDFVYRMKCCNHGNNYWVGFDATDAYNLKVCFANEKDAIPVKLYKDTNGTYKMQSMWNGQATEGKWVSLRESGGWLDANHALEDAMPMELEECSP